VRKTFTIGGASVTVDADEATPFLTILRNQLERKSVVKGCANQECGSCRVMVNGALVPSCTLSMRDIPDGAVVAAREDVEAEPLVQETVAAFEAERPTRCRLCVGGLAVTAHRITTEADTANREAQIEDALAHATCMCTGRGSLRRALHTALLRRP
jgi:aerobic-type carbon monoxide dehydrogenase small subunit (CoxS/CutS family)